MIALGSFIVASQKLRPEASILLNVFGVAEVADIVTRSARSIAKWAISCDAIWRQPALTYS